MPHIETERWKDFAKTILAAFIGALLVVCSDIAKEKYMNKEKDEVRKIRKENLAMMLCDPYELKPTGLWRNLKTLSSAVGLKEDETTDLLVELKARAGLAKNNTKEGTVYWGLISLHPLRKDSPYYNSYSREERYKFVIKNYKDSCGGIYKNPVFKKVPHLIKKSN
ncbi:MAG: hypothetical protein ACL93V_01880 [Candidatus Electrothrix sp. YB6]